MRISQLSSNLICNLNNIRSVMVFLKGNVDQFSKRKEVKNNPTNHSEGRHGGVFCSRNWLNAAPAHILEDSPVLVGNDSSCMITNLAFAKGMQGTRYESIYRWKPADDEDGEA